MANDKTATFPIRVEDEASAPATNAANALQTLRARVESGSASIKAMQADLRLLRGSTDEVKSAKAELKAKIDAERQALSAASLQIIKAGTSLTKLQSDSKASAAAQEELKSKTDAMTGSLSKTHGPLSGLVEKFEGLSTSEGRAAMGMGLVVGAAAALVAGAVALTAGLIAGAIALGRWALEGANINRSAALVREAFTGSAEQAENLYSQIDALAHKVPTAKAALQDLSTSLLQSKFSGQTLVDSFNAIGQASAALGDQVGGKLRGILERGIMPNGREGRFFVTPQELIGTGVAFEQLAQSLAKRMKVGVAQAKQALLAGRVPLGEGAAALRETVEQRFGKLNARKMLDFDVMKSKFGESLQSLTKDIKIEPLLQAVSKFFKLFDESTDAGAAMKELVTDIGNGLVTAITKAEPIAEDFLYGVLVAAIKAETQFYKIRNAILDAFAEHPGLKKFVDDFAKNVDTFKAGKAVVEGLAIAVGLLAVNAITLGVVLLSPVIALALLVIAARKAWNELKAIDWKAAGGWIIDGLVSGLSSAKFIAAITGLGKDGLHAFKGSIDAHSPSRAFRDEAANIPAGAALGVRDGTPDVEDAISGMADPAAMRGGGAQARGGGSPVVVHVNINAQGATADAVQGMSDPSFLAKLTKAVEEALAGAGVPIMKGAPT